MKKPVVFIHIVGKLENEEYQYADAYHHILELVRNGYTVERSVKAEDENVLYVTLKRGEFV